MDSVYIDSISFETPALHTITTYPKDGIYVSDVYLEGSSWNYAGGFLEESRPMELL